MRCVQEFINTAFNTTDDVSATIIITLLVFFLGGVSAFIARIVSQEIAQQRVRKVVRRQLQVLSSLIEGQMQQYSEFARVQLNEDKKEPNFHLSFTLFTPIIVLREIGYRALDKAYSDGIINVLLNTFISGRLNAPGIIIEAVESADFWKVKSLADLEKFVEIYNRSNETRNDAIVDAQKIYEEMFAEIAVRHDLSEDLKDYLGRLDLIISTIQKNPFYNDPKVLQTGLVLPVLELNRSDRKVTAFSRHLSYPMLRADKAYKEMKNTLSVYRSIFEGHTKSMEDSHQKINKVLTDF
jgi:hypothetical protein